MSFSLSAAEYGEFREMLENSSGIMLGEGKEYLVTSRLRRLLEQHDLSSVTELVANSKRNSRLQDAVIDAMTTNETLWFRDDHPYRIFRERLLPELAQKRQGIKIWSAACSTGQEPYSLSIEIEEYLRKNPGSISSSRIVATDISSSALAQARQGMYPQLAIRRGMSDDHLKRYFSEVKGKEAIAAEPLRTHQAANATVESSWQISRQIQSRVEFRSLNLQQSFATLGKFDVIYCRNVLIYFSADLKADILRRMHGCLNPGGYLILGASEAMNHLGDYYEMVQCHPGIIYRAK